MEGTRVECYKCHSLLYVPIHEGLKPVRTVADDIADRALGRNPEATILDSMLFDDYIPFGNNGPVAIFARKILRIVRQHYWTRAANKIPEILTGEEPNEMVCSCPHCQKKYHTHIDHEGKIGKCHNCNKGFEIKKGQEQLA
jgi:hypothetical protein